MAKRTIFAVLQHSTLFPVVTISVSWFRQAPKYFRLIVFIPGSMLHAMFSERFDTKPSEDGSYFIDRDGTHFRYILNYLRTGQLIVPKDQITREELLAEAEFYQVEGIIKALKVSCFKDSVILSSDQRETLVNWLKGSRTITNDSDKLIYRASRNGWTASNFHSCCDNKGPTVTVVKSGNYIFGGYTEQHWDGKSYFNPLTQLLVNIVRWLIIYMKKLLDSDWLRAVQFKCNTSAKSVTPVQKV